MIKRRHCWLGTSVLACLVAVALTPWSTASAAPNLAPTISTQPAMALVPAAGSPASFTAAAIGSPTPSVSWQVASDRNGPWTDLSGNPTETSATLTLTVTAGNLGNAYRAVFTNTAGTATTRPAKLVSRTDWMRDLGNDIADVPLNELTIPGTHDMGTYGINGDSGTSLDNQTPPCPVVICGGIFVSYGRAQDPKDATDELNDGIRYFDLRICGHNDGEFDIPDNWPDFTANPVACHGLEGGALADILSQTRAWALAHPSEVVILDFNHQFQIDLSQEALQIEQAFAVPGGSLLIQPQFCSPADPSQGECASGLTLRTIRDQHLGNVIVNFENDGAPGDTQTTFVGDQQDNFHIQPEPDFGFYLGHANFWGGPTIGHEFCTNGVATTSCFGNNADIDPVLSFVLQNVANRQTFSDTRRLFIQFLQTTPDGGFIAGHLGGSLLDMAVGSDGNAAEPPSDGSNPIVGPAILGCGSPGDSCYGELRPENLNILAINFYNRTGYNLHHALSQAEIDACVRGNGTCDLTTAEQGTINCLLGGTPCFYSDPLTFDFVDQVVRFDEYARTAPVVAVRSFAQPAATGWYNAATLGGQGTSLPVTVTGNDYWYPTGMTALSCLDGSQPFAISSNVPTPGSLALGNGSLSDGIHQISCQATDGANQGFHQVGNQGTGPGSVQTATFQVDTQPPTLSPTVPNLVAFGSSPVVAANATDATSGIAAQSCGTLDTSTPGPHTVSCTAVDKAGNSASASASYTVASPLNAGTTSCNGPYSGSGKEVVVPSGAVCTLLAGTHVSGNVQVQQGGAFDDLGAQIGGNVQANNASWIEIGGGGTVGGNIQVQGLTGEPAGGANSLCNTTVTGDVQVQKNGSGSPLDIGNLGACSGGPALTIGGNLQVQNNAAALTIGGNAVKGNLQVQSNTAQLTVSGNTVHGNIQVNNNTNGAGSTLTGNSAGGNCQLQNDSPGIAGSGNSVGAGHQNTCNGTA